MGFSLIEALVSMAIVLGGVLSLVALAQHVTEAVSRSRRLLTAAVLADEYVALRVGGAFAVTAVDCLQRDRAGCVERLDDAGQVTALLPAFHRRWQIAALAGATVPTWVLNVCVVPVAIARVPGPAPGACVTRVVSEVGP